MKKDRHEMYTYISKLDLFYCGNSLDFKIILIYMLYLLQDVGD